MAQLNKPGEWEVKQFGLSDNLVPRKLKGIVSEGRILSAGNLEGRLAVITPEKEGKPGSG